MACALGCGDDEGAGTTASSESSPSATETQTATGSGTTEMGTEAGTTTDSPPSDSSGTDPTDATDPTDPTGPTDATDPTDPTDATDATDPTDPSDSDSASSGAECDPPTALFFGDPLAASLELDFGAESCAAGQGAIEGAALAFTVRPTGLVDVTATGVSMQSSTHGTYINPSAVTGITTDVAVTIELTDDDSGSSATVEFTFGAAGPMLTELAVAF